MSSWNPEADLSWWEKQQVLADYFDRWRPAVVVETGLYNGIGSCYQFIGRARVVVCDISRRQCEQAEQAGVTWAVPGDTRETFARVLENVHAPALFWLDSHLVTVGGDDRNDAPLREELEALIAWPYAARSVVLIDDVRLMGLDGWPSLEWVLGACRLSGFWQVEVADDVVRCTPVST